ncbi:MAG: carboxypeptidase-like regulatory domain-containing protein [Bacteroidaceae bacterium]|nr:carboxypeptidase-like regulatory domain-containing protein [Bacteroidaceae bacterium]
MRILLLIGYFLFFPFSVLAQQVFRARVVDAETGEAMPFVNVVRTGGRGCVTNMEGDFTIVARAEDSLRFSFVGYQACKWKASEMPNVVKMRPAALSVAGVTVLSNDAILTRTFNMLKQDFKKHGKATKMYLNRITIKSGECEEMVEDFLTAQSAVNVRDMRVVSGQYWTKKQTGEQMESQLQHTNLHNLMMAGPMMRKVSLESSVIQPYPESFSSSFLNYYYTISSQTLQSDGGRLMYVVELRPKVETWKSILYGKLYIDAQTFRLLRFDGAVRGLMTSMDRLGENKELEQPATIRLQFHYTHQRGFTEVEKASAQIHSNSLDVIMTLADADAIAIPTGKSVVVKENLLKAILAAGTSTDLQQEASFMQRTAMERMLADDGPDWEMVMANQFVPPLFSYIQKTMNFNKVVPQEKVYLHFDNMGYFENETLWFKAYVTRTDNGHPSDLSKVLYVELLNPSGDVVKTSKYPIDSLGVSHGDIKLDTLLTSGFYEVRAYTRYMTNWGTNAVFSRVFPVFKAPKKEGDYSDLTIRTMLYSNRDPNNRTDEDSLYQRAIDEGIYTNDLMKTISVKFYPEGGNLIVGKRSRVAMLAVDDNGNPYEGDGFVMNEKGDVLASVQTDTLGRGIFEVVPDTGKLTFQMRNLKKSERRNMQYFTLPEAKREGCVLSVDAVNEQMLATLQCTRGVCGNLLGYVIMHNGNIVACDTLIAVPLLEIELDRKTMPEGVNQMTFFDSRGAIMAERLFFICPNPDKADSIQVVAKTERLKPCGKVEMELHTRPNANLSFSAIDAHTMTNGKQGNMKTWMLLSSDVRGYIHNVDYYFEADDKEHRESADLLMLTQGWRRYDWRLMSERYTFRKAQPIEDRMVLRGKLNVYRKRNPVNNVHLYAILYNEKGESLLGDTRTDSVGNYAFKMPFINGEWKLYIYTAKDGKKKEKRKTYYVGIDRQFSPESRYITPLERQILHPFAPNAFVKKPFQELNEEDVSVPITEKNHLIQNVTVKAKKRYFTNDNWRFKNEAYGRKYATLHYNIDRELDNILDRGEPEPTIFEFLAKNNKMFGNPECIDLPRLGYGWMAYGGRPIKWFVNNGDSLSNGSSFLLPDLEVKRILGVGKLALNSEIGTVGAGVSSVGGSIFPEDFPWWMHDIKSLYIVPDDPREITTAVRIHLYTHSKYITESNKGIRRTYYDGFNIASTFKMEDYSVIPPTADFRRTIYWQPDIITDAQGKAKVEFFNNSTCEEMYISVEGMTLDGKILVNE